MPTISIAFRAPVQVVVDTVTGTVRRVVVIEESVEEDRAGYSENQRSYQPADPADIDQAYAIAQAAATAWPRWTFGW